MTSDRLRETRLRRPRLTDWREDGPMIRKLQMFSLCALLGLSTVACQREQPAAQAAVPAQTTVPAGAVLPPADGPHAQLTPATPVTPVAAVAAPAPVRTVRERSRTVVVRETPRHRTVVKRRSKKKSAAIVAGSAATGAAIGALAGGGKGAAIGAISGGAAGFVYDRATHKKRVRVE